MANILLIEPDAVLACTITQFLEKAGHSVQHVFGAQTALNVVDENAPDVVLMEIQLVKHSGIEFLYEFRSYAEWRHIPAIILSNVPPSEFSAGTKVLRDQLNVRAYHYKPVTKLQTILRTVNDLATATQQV